MQFSEQRQQRCEYALGKARRALLLVARELSEIDQQVTALYGLLVSHKAQACTFDHGELLALLRRQAVIRRQIHNLSLDRARLHEQREGITLDVQRQQQHRQALQRKHMKYEHLTQRLLDERRWTRLRLEEHDIEELLVSQQ
jgi:hypothetical protein